VPKSPLRRLGSMGCPLAADSLVSGGIGGRVDPGRRRMGLRLHRSEQDRERSRRSSVGSGLPRPSRCICQSITASQPLIRKHVDVGVNPIRVRQQARRTVLSNSVSLRFPVSPSEQVDSRAFAGYARKQAYGALVRRSVNNNNFIRGPNSACGNGGTRFRGEFPRGIG
jgi:hypothetical protein